VPFFKISVTKDKDDTLGFVKKGIQTTTRKNSRNRKKKKKKEEKKVSN
jgi:hypothetical protein